VKAKKVNAPEVDAVDELAGKLLTIHQVWPKENEDHPLMMNPRPSAAIWPQRRTCRPRRHMRGCLVRQDGAGQRRVIAFRVRASVAIVDGLFPRGVRQATR